MRWRTSLIFVAACTGDESKTGLPPGGTVCR
jgi:hypothetical protein